MNEVGFTKLKFSLIIVKKNQYVYIITNCSNLRLLKRGVCNLVDSVFNGVCDYFVDCYIIACKYRVILNIISGHKFWYLPIEGIQK